jgi:hypothetical protein
MVTSILCAKYIVRIQRKACDCQTIQSLSISHYETKRLITDSLKEFDIDVDRHEADRSLIIRDVGEIILRPTLDSLLQYLKTLERLAIQCGKSGIDVIVDLGSFRHIRKKQELVEYKNRLNIICGASSVRFCAATTIRM